MAQLLSLTKVLNSGAAWYRGDFHAHTSISDGFYSPLELVDVARAERLDFFAVTDHNTIVPSAYFGGPNDILIIPGIEVTLTEGHFNLLGIEEQTDWMKAVCSGQSPITFEGSGQTVTKFMKQAAGRAWLNSINHPFLSPWSWLDQTTDLTYLHCLEILNDPSWPANAQANPQAVTMWSRWLNAGYRISAIGGSDYHRPEPRPGENKPPERLGLPSTYVYATELSGIAVLNGVRERRVYVSVGPQMSFQAQVNGATHDIGADLGQVDGQLTLTAAISNSPKPGLAQIVKNGQVVAETVIAENSLTSLTYHDQIFSAEPAWYRLDVWTPHGQILAITNPIFAGPRQKPGLLKYRDFLDQ